MTAAADTACAAHAARAQVTILPVSVAAIFDAPNAADLIRAYAKECLIPDAQPQRMTYEAMERTGVLQCFAAYAGPEGASLLIGFVSVICAVMPHCGKRLATVESLFVEPDYRDTGAGVDLIAAAEQCAVNSGCLAITASARVDSAFDKVLSRRAGYALTHVQHTRWLA
jgi:GNAT superfamily N-acetyltransferase